MFNPAVVRAALTAALLSALAVPVMALTQTAVTLSGFSYTLKDLNAADGVAPSLSWLGAAYVSISDYEGSQTGWQLDGNSWSPQWTSQAGPNMSGSAAISGSSPLGTSQMSIAAGASGLGDISAVTRAADGQWNIAFASATRSFTLSAGSQVTFQYVVDGLLANGGLATHGHRRRAPMRISIPRRRTKSGCSRDLSARRCAVTSGTTGRATRTPTS